MHDIQEISPVRVVLSGCFLKSIDMLHLVSVLALERSTFHWNDDGGVNLDM